MPLCYDSWNLILICYWIDLVLVCYFPIIENLINWDAFPHSERRVNLNVRPGRTLVELKGHETQARKPPRPANILLTKFWQAINLIKPDPHWSLVRSVAQGSRCPSPIVWATKKCSSP